MYFSLASQFQGFLISVIIGILLGAFYDVFRIFRTVFKTEKRAVFFQDLFYMLCTAFVTFLLALGVNYGDVRFYIIAGEMIGWCLYYLTVGMVTYQVFRFVTRIAHKFLIDPIKGLILKLFHWIFHKIKILGKKVKIVALNQKKRLKQHREIVYNRTISKRRMKKSKAGKANVKKQKRMVKKRRGLRDGAGYEGYQDKKTKR